MQRHRLNIYDPQLLCSAGDFRGRHGTTKREVKRIQPAATVIDEMMAAPDKGIPENVLSSAECVGVVPSMVKGGFIVGADYGKGVVACRTKTGQHVRYSQEHNSPAHRRVGCGSPDWDSSCSQIRTRAAMATEVNDGRKYLASLGHDTRKHLSEMGE
jgi:hypothetical protein